MVPIRKSLVLFSSFEICAFWTPSLEAGLPDSFLFQPGFFDYGAYDVHFEVIFKGISFGATFFPMISSVNSSIVVSFIFQGLNIFSNLNGFCYF